VEWERSRGTCTRGGRGAIPSNLQRAARMARYRVVRLTRRARRPAHREYLARIGKRAGWTTDRAEATTWDRATAEGLAAGWSATETRGYRYTTERVIRAPIHRGD